MPEYTYRCSACEHTWEEFRTMAAYKAPCDEPCPECEEMKVNKAVDGISSIKVDTNKDCRIAKNLPGEFRERMNTIADGLPKSSGVKSRMLDQYK